MKYNRVLTALFLAAAALCCSAGFAADPQWIINNGDDYPRLTIGQGRAGYSLGLSQIVPSGTDVTVNVGMKRDEAFKAEERPFFALRYKMTTKQKFGGIFFTNDQEIGSFTDKCFSVFNVKGDGEWHDLVVDMRTYPHKCWKGVITGFRLDPTNPSDTESMISLSRLGFFKSEDDARAFLAAANDKPDYSQDSEFVNSISRALVPGSAMKEGDDAPDFLVANPEESASDDAPKYLKERETYVVYWTPNGQNKEQIVQLSDVSSLGFATYVAQGAGTFRVGKSTQNPTLTDIADRPDAEAIRFAVARGALSPGELGKQTGTYAFNPDKPLDSAEATALADSLEKLANQSNRCAPLKAFAERIADVKERPLSRAEAARLYATTLRDVLGTNVESPFGKDYFTRERLRIGAWGNFQTRDFGEDYMRAYADCGFDFLLGLSCAPRDMLPLGDKYGVEILVNDGSWRNPGMGQAEYMDHPSYTGCYVTDEPGSDKYDELSKACNRYFEITGKTPYVNLLPMYANAAQLKYGAAAAAIEYYDSDPDLFRKYCAGFCEKFNTNYICTDIYPLNWVEGKKKTYAEYVESINIIASVAREYNREFWCFIQTFAWTKSKRTPTEQEYRWQCYSMLSFGCRCILCWTYAGYKEEFPSLVDIESRKTRAWYDARPVLWELRRLSDVYVQYRNLGAFTVNCTDETPYLKMTNEYKDFDAIREIKCADPVLVGCFEKKEGAGKAFTLVNMTDFEKDHGTTVRMKLDADSATAYYRGVPQTVRPDAEGWFDFSLASGEGVFVTIEK